MACNTAYYYYDRIIPFIKIPMLNMIDETAREIAKLKIKTVGLLATDGVLESKVYEDKLQEYKINITKPSKDGQKAVMALIYKGIKAADYSLDITNFRGVLEELYEGGAEALILGCTELPLAFEMFRLQGQTIDPTKILAERAVEFAFKSKYN
ncbi:MAG: amino acid racemase [Clostridium sp.]